MLPTPFESRVLAMYIIGQVALGWSSESNSPLELEVCPRSFLKQSAGIIKQYRGRFSILIASYPIRSVINEQLPLASHI